MLRIRDNARIAPNLLLAILLVAAQSLASMHELGHDAGTPQNQVCTTCVAASQLGAACIDNTADIEVERFTALFSISADSNFNTTHALAVRQRGPPASL